MTFPDLADGWLLTATAGTPDDLDPALAAALTTGVPTTVPGTSHTALLDAGGSLLDALSYEGAVTAALIGGQTYDLVEGTVLPTSVADSNTVAGSLGRSKRVGKGWGNGAPPPP